MNPYDISSSSFGRFIIKINSDCAYAEYENGKGFKCLFKKGKENSLYAKYSDLVKNKIIIIKNREMIFIQTPKILNHTH